MSSLRQTFIQYGPIRSAGQLNIYCSLVNFAKLPGSRHISDGI